MTVSGKERLLVLEDDPRVMQFASSQLKSLGYDVAFVSTAADALKILDEQPFNLLFSDVVLGPGISGVELARRARAIRPEIGVLLTSGYPTEAFEQYGKPDADMPLLRKPYRRKDLAEMVHAALAGRK